MMGVLSYRRHASLRQVDRPSSPGSIRSSASRSKRSRIRSRFIAWAFSATIAGYLFREVAAQRVVGGRRHPPPEFLRRPVLPDWCVASLFIKNVIGMAPFAMPVSCHSIRVRMSITGIPLLIISSLINGSNRN